jgi:hypothetical protein
LLGKSVGIIVGFLLGSEVAVGIGVGCNVGKCVGEKLMVGACDGLAVGLGEGRLVCTSISMDESSTETEESNPLSTASANAELLNDELTKLPSSAPVAAPEDEVVLTTSKEAVQVVLRRFRLRRNRTVEAVRVHPRIDESDTFSCFATIVLSISELLSDGVLLAKKLSDTPTVTVSPVVGAGDTVG